VQHGQGRFDQHPEAPGGDRGIVEVVQRLRFDVGQDIVDAAAGREVPVARFVQQAGRRELLDVIGAPGCLPGNELNELLAETSLP